MGEYSQIVYDTEGSVARVTLNRPGYRNAQSRVLLEEMDRAFAEAVDDTSVRVIVLRGAGEHFSAGHDLGTPDELADREARPYEQGFTGQYQRSWDLYIDLGLRWRNLPKPTIAAVQGYCIFGGWMIAAAMDVIFAADDAKFLPGQFQYFSVPWDLEIRRAKAALFEGRFVTAAEAERWGFVYRVAPRAELDAAVMAYARRVAENDSFQLRVMKLAINQAQDIQGFTTHIVDAHTAFMLRTAGSGGRSARMAGRRRLNRVQLALAFEEEDRG